MTILLEVIEMHTGSPKIFLTMSDNYSQTIFLCQKKVLSYGILKTSI